MMKKLLFALAASALLSAPAMAENIDQANGTSPENATISYKWNYWNEKQSSGMYVSNWVFVYDKEFTETPTATLEYTLKKGEETVVETKNAILSTPGNEQIGHSNFYDFTKVLEDGDYTVDWTFSLTPAGETEAQIQTGVQSFTVKTVYNPYEFKYTKKATANTITIDYEFVTKDNSDMPDNAEYHVELGIIGFPNQIRTERSGSITFAGLQPNTIYTVWTNSPYVKVGDETYKPIAPNFEVKTEDGDAPVVYKFKFHSEVAEITHNTITVKYKFEEVDGQDIPENATYAVSLGCTPGNIDVAGAEGPEGTIVFVNREQNEVYTIWNNSPSVTIDGIIYQATPDVANYIAGTTKMLPIITVTAKVDEKSIKMTEADIDYEIIPDNRNIEGVTYTIWCVVESEEDLPAEGGVDAQADVNEVEVGRIDNTTDVTGKMHLTGLTPEKISHLRVKAIAKTTDGLESETALYPAADSEDIFSVTTGIDNIAVDAAVDPEAEYFNLQGVRVAAPYNGVYIVVKNGKATKVLVK